MQSFHRAFALLSIVTALGFFAGCGGPGAPVPGSSNPAEEASNAALAPEGSAEETAASDAGDAAVETTETDAAAEPAAEGEAAASAPESGN